MDVESQPIMTHEKNIISFVDRMIHNEVVSARTGRPMFDHVLDVMIRVPGQKDVMAYEVDRDYADGRKRQNEIIYKRFGQYIEDYKRKSDAKAATGTPIEMLPSVDMRMAATLKHLGIHTVEVLAEVTDGNLQNIGMGARDLRKKAQEFLASSQNAAAASQLAAEKKVLEDRFAALEAKFNDLAEAMAALPEEDQSKVKAELSKRGRRAA